VNLLFLEEFPHFGGGSERVSLSLCQHAIERGHRAWLAFDRPGDMVDAYREVGASCEAAPIRPIVARKPIDVWQSLTHVRRILRTHAIDLVFTSQVNYASVLAAISQWMHVPTVVHLGLEYDYPSPIFRSSVRHVSLGVAPSAHTADGWRRRGWPARSLTVIPNGVDTQRFSIGAGRAAARAELGLKPETGPVVAYVGRVVRAKGVFTLLKAFAQYHRTQGAGHLMVVGAGEQDDAAALQREADEIGLAKSAWDLRQATANPESVYRAADLVVVPSEWEEPFGLVPLEAMACGTLAVVSDRGILPTFVTPAAPQAVFAAGNAEQLGDRLAYWLSDAAAREQAASRAAAHVRSEFGLARCGDGYLSAFSGLVAA
jgi:glycosyltransferase involved in cell wall biosynthesis